MKILFLSLFILPFFLISLADAQPSSVLNGITTAFEWFSPFSNIFSAVINATGIPFSINNIQNPPPSSTSGTLIIYYNPAGYFEFALSNSSVNNVFSDASLYENTAPDQSAYPLINISSSNSYTYDGAVFYTYQGANIVPLEQTISNNGLLTTTDFLNFVESNPYLFQDTTLYFDSNTTFSWGAFLNSLSNPILQVTTILAPTVGFEIAFSHGITNRAVTFMPSSEAVTFISNASITPNPGLALNVEFNYEGQIINTNSGKLTDNMYQFNADVDGVNSYGADTYYNYNTFWNETLALLFETTIVAIIVDKLNGG